MDKLEGLFAEPYEHARWLADQQTLIDRLKGSGLDTTNLKAMQKAGQCSILIPEIMRYHIEKLEEKKDLTTESKADINSIDANC